jgi:hypothetical protein
MTIRAPIIASFAALLLSASAPGAFAQAKGGQVSQPLPIDAPACGSVPRDGERQTCQCPDGFAQGRIWGSNPYTADSNLCTAALHAGMIGTGGGVVQVVGRPGSDAYPASTRNGVASGSWGSFGRSFEVLTFDDMVPDPGAALPACGTLPREAEALRCACDPDAGAGGVWGSGPYTADSDICTAARHAGVIGAGGGPVRVLRAAGLDWYSASTVNGVATSGYGSYGSSFVFDRN